MKLLHKIVKSSRGVTFDGTVAIDNTVVIKPKPVEVVGESGDEADELNRQIEERIKIEVSNRLAACERELSDKEKKAFEDIQTQKSKIVSEAMLKARNIVDDANKQAVIIKEEARKSGFLKGEAEGKAEVKKQMQENLDKTALLLKEFTDAKEQLYISHENEILDLTYDITKKITLNELKTDKEIIFDIVRQSLKAFRNSDFVKISLAKCDVEASVVTDEDFVKSISGNIPDVEIELLPDAKSGTVLIDNDKEIIDASVPTQLDLLKEIMNNTKK